MNPFGIDSFSKQQGRHSQQDLGQLLSISPDALLNGIRFVSGPGTGKTLAMNLLVLWQHFWYGLPTIVIDPTGALCSYFFNKLLYLEPHVQRKAAERVKYIDVAASDYIVPLPLYHPPRNSSETHFAIANRLIEVIERQDRHLETASIEGLNAIKDIGWPGGMIMAELDLQVTDLADLLLHPKNWTARLREVRNVSPFVQRAVDTFYQYIEQTPEIRRRRAGSLLTKLLPFVNDPFMQAAFAGSGPGLDWAEEIRQGRTVLLDFGGETDRARCQFKLIWCFLDILSCLKQRGIAGRANPVLLAIDEISSLLGPRQKDESILGQDLHELITVWARNFGVKVCIAHQYPSQLEPTINHALTQLGTQFIGNIQDPEDAYYLARQFHYYDPYMMKKKEPVWMNVAHPYLTNHSTPQIIDYRSAEFTAEEQYIMAADAMRRLPKFHFLLRPALGEGNLTGQLRRVTIERFDKGMYPDETLLAEVRHYFRKRDGRPIPTVLKEIEARGQKPLPVAPVKPTSGHAIIAKGATPAHDKPHRLSAKTGAKSTENSNPEPAGSGESWRDDIWKEA